MHAECAQSHRYAPSLRFFKSLLSLPLVEFAECVVEAHAYDNDWQA
jgi:hypothetical protein